MTQTDTSEIEFDADEFPIERTDPTNTPGQVESAESGTEPTTDSSDDLEARITAIEQSKVNEQSVPDVSAAQLLALPGVADAVRRAQNGNPDPVTPPTSTLEDKYNEPEDWESLDNRDVARETTKMVANEVASLVEAQLQPLKDQNAQLMAHAQQQENLRVQAEIKTLKETAPDFDSLQNEMVAISKTSPGLSVQEYYTLAGMRAGKPAGPVQGTESERPTVSNARPAKPTTRTPMPPMNKDQKFTSNLESAIDRAMKKPLSRDDE